MKKLSFKILCAILLISFVKISPQTKHSEFRNNIRLNEKTGFISAIYNADINNVEGISPDMIAKNYLSNNYKLFGLRKDISDLTIVSVRENLGTKHIILKQFYEGIEVINANIVISLNRGNKISTVISNYHPISKLEIRPIVNKSEAETKAKNLFAASGNDIITKSDLKIFIDENGKEHLAWVVSTELASGLPIGYIILDANNIEVLQKIDFGQKYVNGTGRVFDPDPGTYLRNANLTSSDDVSSAYKSVTLENLNGYGYIQGKYAVSSNIVLGLDSLTYNSNNTFTYNRNRVGFREANIYFFINKIRTYVGNLGFNPFWRGDYQAIQYDATVPIQVLGSSPEYYPQNDKEYILFEWDYFNQNAITSSEDQSVVIHEYGHALHDALLSGGISNKPADGSDLAGIGEGIGDYLEISYRRTTQSSNPFRPNEASNYAFPSARTSIKNAANANYSTWNQENNYGKGSIWASTIMDLEYNTATDPSSGTKLGKRCNNKIVIKMSLLYRCVSISDRLC